MKSPVGPDLAVDVEAMRVEDWPAVAAIYAEGLATGKATFETEVPEHEHWDATRLQAGRLVARDADGTIVGWAALGRVSRRQFMSGVAEVSIYVAGAAQGRGVGRQLLSRLIDESEDAGIWTLQAAVFPENEATIRLHERAGFRVVGRREKIAMLDGHWRDTLLLERRSDRAGLPGD
jgi:phosphinothricin acetyltransferase